MKFPPDAYPQNSASSKKEPPPRILRWIFLGSIWAVWIVGLLMIIITISICTSNLCKISIGSSEWTVPILYERSLLFLPYDWVH
jgi:hypothetical protein